MRISLESWPTTGDAKHVCTRAAFNNWNKLPLKPSTAQAGDGVRKFQVVVNWPVPATDAPIAYTIDVDGVTTEHRAILYSMLNLNADVPESIKMIEEWAKEQEIRDNARKHANNHEERFCR